MPLLTQNLRRLPNYVKRFGLLRGPTLFWKAYCSTAPLKVPGYPGKVSIRRTASDTAIFFQVLVKEEYDAKRWPQYSNLLCSYHKIMTAERRPLIIDGGGNIGLAAIWFAQLFPEALIFTVEPDEQNLAVLLRNVAPYENIRVLAGGVWHRSCRLRIENPEAGSAMFRVAECHDGSLRGYSVPEIASMEPDSDLFIVKLDIEGGEKALFGQGTDWAANVPLTIIETHDWLFPGQGTSGPFWRCVSEREVDVLFGGENVFVFESPGPVTDA